MHAIITILDVDPLSELRNESLSTIVSFDALNGTCELFMSIALMHSFNANKLLLISAPSMRLYLLLLCVSCALSDPAKSTSNNFPIVFYPLGSLTVTQHIA
jgi:hypothetical protein